jgi:hypothetical protein
MKKTLLITTGILWLITLSIIETKVFAATCHTVCSEWNNMCDTTCD